MKFRYTITRAIIDLLILCIGLFFIYLSALPGEEISWLQTDGLGVLLIVFVSYLLVIAFIELLLVYMRQDTWVAKTIKSLIAVLLVALLFPFALFGLLWLFGYGIEGDVVPVIMLITIVRFIIKIWLSWVFERRSAPI